MTRTVSAANQALLNPLGKTHKKSFFFIGRTTKGGGGVKPLILKKKIYHMMYKIKKITKPH